MSEVAIVTGGTRGIGKAIASKLAIEGYRVCIIGTNEEKGKETLTSLQGKDHCFYRVNVADKAEVDRVVEEILKRYEKVDLLVNNAGVTRDGLLMKMTENNWDEVMAVNVKSCYNLCHALVRPMMKARRGSIVNISSAVGLMGNPGQTNYAASKGAVIAFTKALAKEMASRNILVNCIAPGYIKSAMTDALSETQKEKVLDQIPLGRIGEADSVANAVLFLAKADYITGHVLTVDGGMTMY